MFEWRQRLCRTCGTHIDKSSATPLFEGENYPMVIIIENITMSYLEKEHDMPELICQGCKRDLERFLEFRTKFMANNEFLQYKRNELQLQEFDSANDLVAAVNIEDKEIASEPQVAEDNETYDEPLLAVKHEDNTLENEAVVGGGKDKEPPLTTINVEDNTMDNDAEEPLLTAINVEDNTLDNDAVASLLAAVNIKDKEMDDNVEYKAMDDYAVEYLVSADEVIDNHVDVSPPLVPPDKGEEERDENGNKHIAVETQSSTLTIKRKPKRKPRQRKKSNKTWICHICEGEFKCSTYFKLHIMRHSGNKQIECDICHARYYTKPEMRRHRILHTDARPYACRFCDKTFRGCSSKAVHERSHTNERPFSCQYCDETFRSSATRRMHELVHTNSRNYHCESCDQSFLRSSHLTLHKRSKLHKRQVTGAMDD
ncbi:zinc finger protein 62 homolog [Drosophila madeirensis]|uniref:Zinc finger protein 62 homolog n=1 Tax=Drosophila madeirensis TaxID=30013 RepID=A0AAU9EQK3_DROMD